MCRVQRIRPTQKSGTWGQNPRHPKKPHSVGKSKFREDMLKLQGSDINAKYKLGKRF